MEYIQVFTIRGISPVTEEVIEVDIIADSVGDARRQAMESGLRLVMVAGARLARESGGGRHGGDSHED